MKPIVFIGDEASCAGFALAGVENVSPAPAELAAAFDRACGRASLVVLSAATARALPAARLAQARAALEPLVAVLPDAVAPAATDELTVRVHSVLGIEA